MTLSTILPPISVVDVVPLLKTVMARMLPMLGLAKVENYQWVFSTGTCSYHTECQHVALDFLLLPVRGIHHLFHIVTSAIARFCEAISDYLADEKRAGASGISAIQFEGEIYSAYEQLFNIWLLSKEARVSTENSLPLVDSCTWERNLGILSWM